MGTPLFGLITYETYKGNIYCIVGIYCEKKICKSSDFAIRRNICDFDFNLPAIFAIFNLQQAMLDTIRIVLIYSVIGKLLN